MRFNSLALVVVAWCLLLLGAPGCRAAGLVAVPRSASPLVDQAGLLTPADRSAIEARLRGIQESGRAQIAILMAAETGDEPLASYALRVAEAWQLGRKNVDNGLLILVVPSRGQARLEVGYGLEGDIPDLRAAMFVRDYLQRAQGGDVAAALNALLDRIEEALPPASGLPRPLAQFVGRHAEWKLPIFMLVLSVFTLLPLLFTAVFGGLRLGPGEGPARAWPSAGTVAAAVVSACLFALVLGFGARTFWDSKAIGWEAAAMAFPLPLLWSLQACDHARMGAFARAARLAGNLGLFAYVFALLTIVATAVMYVEHVRELWIAPLFALLFAAAPLVFLLGGRSGARLMKLVGCYMYFLVALAISYFALQGVLRNPAPTALTVAAVFAVLVAIGLTLDEREATRRSGRRKGGWAWMFTAAALLFMLPFMLVALLHALTGDGFTSRFALVMSGDGTFSALLWWVSGALGGSALVVGLGGRFGGGGASG